MGAVYQAMDENLNCLVVVKETFASNDEQRQAFRREAQLLANLNHPTLPKVMDHFTHDKGQFLVMQFVSGHDLAELMELREQPFAVEKVLGWADQLLEALDELHSYDPPIVHRDIKPANLKVTPKDRIILLDFGLAKGAAGQMSTADAQSQPQSIYGYTLNYAPLEQIRGAGTDPRSDLYSLAATMWSLLTRQVPPDALARVGDKEEGKTDPLRPAHEVNPQVPVAVSNALHRALSLNRNNRPANASEMRGDLHPVPSRTAPPPTLVKVDPQAANQPRQQSSPTAETVEIPQPPAGTLQNQPPLTMPVAKPPDIPARAEVVPTAASIPPPGAKRNSRAAILGGSVGLIVIAGVIAVLALIGWFILKSALRKTGLSTPSAAGIEMLWIPPGNFMMGSDYDTAAEKPVHRVTVGSGFYLGKFEVTQAQWQSVMGNNPSMNKGCGGSCPVDSVSWIEVQEFIKKLNQLNDGYTYRLPTEAEWEYACRAGATGYYYGPLDSIAWHKGNADGRSHPVGQKQPNAFGLYDMTGNVSEWVQDTYHEGYTNAPSDGSAWTGGGSDKVLRGGSWHPITGSLGSSLRGSSSMSEGDADYGFRLVAVR